MPLWQRLTVLGSVLLVTVVVARLIDRRIARRDLPPEAITRYRVLRRSITTAIVFVGLLSGLLVIPQVRAVAGGLLACVRWGCTGAAVWMSSGGLNSLTAVGVGQHSFVYA